MTIAPEGEANTEYDWVKPEVAAEILKQAQAMISAQHAGIDAVNTKLTTILSQAVTLGTVVFGIAPLFFVSKAGMSGWVGIGLSAAGILAICAAYVAWHGLHLHRWVAPGLAPERTALPSVLKAQPQTAMMLMAWTYQDGVSENDRVTARVNRELRTARLLFAAIPVAGLVVAVIAWLGFRFG